ncbi:uncharacterized protein LOC116806104 [Drosophila grimshawi]|uniref:uncharacterized protein LOC116806104 n=1 Tax=Drosophila grimshawi TaxID=7222 RepID=UPI000C8705D4|nr:uncharacterized protein LOC116806104 [Drosophila grimshawi]
MCGMDGICYCGGHEVGDLVPDCEDCIAYYKCGLNSIERELCPLGLIFDAQVMACVPGKCPRIDGDCPHPMTPTTPTPTPTPDGCQNAAIKCGFPGQIIGHAEHCRFFWICVENCPILGFCEIGMWFDRHNFVCDFPENVHNCPAGKD